MAINLPSLSIYLLITFLLIIIVLGCFCIVKVMEKKDATKLSKNVIFAISVIAFFLFLYVGFFGQVVTEANGARINKNGTISQFYLYKDETYVEQIKTIGKVTIKRQKSDDKKVNEQVKIVRNFFKGTQIYMPAADDLYPTNKQVTQK